jgi:NAD(P)H dehydrogenase (quinone)
MTRISVVFHSNRGHTAALAEAVFRGASSVEGVTAHLLRITGEQVVNGRWNAPEVMATLAASDAILLGSPTYMGSASAVFKAFLEKAFDPWMVQGWKDKFASGFTDSASQSGDKLSTLIELAVFAAQMGMMWIPVGDAPGNNWSGGSTNDINRLGSWLGLMSQSNGDQSSEVAPPTSDRQTAERHGRRVALIARRWRGEGSYETERKGEAATNA